LLLETSAFEHLRSRGYIQRDAIFAGHSLGKYAAIWAFWGFVPLLSLMELIFYRGLTMQTTMIRGQHGETNFGMVAANPQRVGKMYVQFFTFFRE
jgi:fatty acid synthase subunit beta